MHQEMCYKTNRGRKSTALQVLVNSERKWRRGRADIHLHNRGKVLADLGSPISPRETNVRVDAKGTEPWQGLNQSSSTTTTKIKCGRTTWIFFLAGQQLFCWILRRAMQEELEQIHWSIRGGKVSNLQLFSHLFIAGESELRSHRSLLVWQRWKLGAGMIMIFG